MLIESAAAISGEMWLGIGAALAQTVGFAIYALRMSRGACRPNALGWTMGIYGALAIFLFQAGTGAPAVLLVLPAVGVLGGLLVLAGAIAGDATPPVEPQDWLVLVLNAGIVLWLLLLLAGPAAELGLGEELGPVFALLSGIGAVTAGWPTLRATCLDPRREPPVAWLAGSVAQGLYALGVMSAGLSWHFLVYPVLCQATQMLIGLFALGEGESLTGGRGAATG